MFVCLFVCFFLFFSIGLKNKLPPIHPRKAESTENEQVSTIIEEKSLLKITLNMFFG